MQFQIKDLLPFGGETVIRVSMDGMWDPADVVKLTYDPIGASGHPVVYIQIGPNALLKPSGGHGGELRGEQAGASLSRPMEGMGEAGDA